MADAVELPPHELRNVAGLLHGHRAHARQHLALLLEARHVADGEDLGMTRNAAVPADDDAALGIGGHAELLRERIGLHACCPHHGRGVDALARATGAEAGQLVSFVAGLEREPRVVDVDDTNAGTHLGAELAKLLDRALGE